MDLLWRIYGDNIHKLLLISSISHFTRWLLSDIFAIKPLGETAKSVFWCSWQLFRKPKRGILGQDFLSLCYFLFIVSLIPWDMTIRNVTWEMVSKTRKWILQGHVYPNQQTFTYELQTLGTVRTCPFTHVALRRRLSLSDALWSTGITLLGLLEGWRLSRKCTLRGKDSSIIGKHYYLYVKASFASLE